MGAKCGNLTSKYGPYYPLVNIQKAMERSTMLLMGKSTISTGPFSIAMLVHQRVDDNIPILNPGTR